MTHSLAPGLQEDTGELVVERVAAQRSSHLWKVRLGGTRGASWKQR